MTVRKREFTEEFRRDAVQLLWLSSKSSTEIEARMQIPPGCLKQWVGELCGNYQEQVQQIHSYGE